MNNATAFCLPTVDDMEDGWIIEPVRVALQAAGRGAATRRAASTLLRAHYDLAPKTVPACRAWLLQTVAAQKTLAFDLGVAATIGAMRRAVHGPQVAALIDALGAAGYRRALLRSPLPVQGLPPSALADAIEHDNLADFFGAVGVALLTLDLDADDPYVRLRMRFSFPPAWWDGKPSGLTVDCSDLTAAIDACRRG